MFSHLINLITLYKHISASSIIISAIFNTIMMSSVDSVTAAQNQSL